MTQYGFYFDSTRCTGCRTCEMACKDYNDLPANYAFRRVFDYEGGDWKDNGDGTFEPTSWAYHVSMACNHCAMPACVANCPQGALEKDADTGLVSRDEEKCIGCGTCVKSCPYEVPVVDTETMKSAKCDAAPPAWPRARCRSAWTPVRFGPSSSGTSKSCERRTPAPWTALPPWLLRMRRSLCGHSACPAAKDCGDTTGAIANPKEVENA